MLPAPQRLQANQDFRRIYAHGRSWKNDFAVLYLMWRTGEAAKAAPGRRIGFVVSKKQGDAVVRNRIKRRLREAVRLRLPDLRAGCYDLIFVGRGKLKTADWPAVQAAIDDLIRRGGLRNDSTLPSADRREAPPAAVSLEEP